jgi:hypothetical protein
VIISRFDPKRRTPWNSLEIKPIFGFLLVILQIECGVWREKEEEAIFPSTKGEEEQDLERHNLFIVKLGLISLKQGLICRYGQQFATLHPFFFFFLNFCYVSLLLVRRDCFLLAANNIEKPLFIIRKPLR